MIKVEGENKMAKSLPEELSGIISQVASITTPKFTQAVKKRKKQVYKGEKMEVGNNRNHTAPSDFDLDEFWVAESTSNKVWRRKYPS